MVTMSWETLSGLSELIIALSSVVGLSQLFIAKKDMQIRSKREAMMLAATQIEHFRVDIIPLLSEITKLRNKGQYPKEVIVLEKFTNQEAKNINERIFNISLGLLGRDKDLLSKLTDASNAIESFAVYFTNGIADEKIAFLPIAQMYCEFVEEFYFFYCFQRDELEICPFDQTIKLYSLWKARLENQNLNLKKDEIEKMIGDAHKKELEKKLPAVIGA